MKKGCMKSNKRRKIAKSYPRIPSDNLLDIISRLPAKSLYRFKCVSKEWCSLIQDQNFVDFYSDCRRKQHNEAHSIRLLGRLCSEYYFYFIDHNGKTSEILLSFNGASSFTDPLVPACNGLFCYLGDCYNGDFPNLVVWNPIASEYKILPKPDFLHPITNPCSLIKLGFGFDIVSRKYKLVGCHAYSPWHVQVLTLGDTEWRTIKGGCIDKVDFRDKIIHVNGALYWLSTKRFHPNREIVRGDPCKITSFNLAEEQFGEVLVPDDAMGFVNLGHWLCDLEGCLCLIGYDNKMLDLWVLKTNNKQQQWVNTRITLPFEMSLKLLDTAIPIQHGEILVQSKQIFYLCRYDQEGNMLKTIELEGLPKFMLVVGKYEDYMVTLRDIFGNSDGAILKLSW
ncbi:F-box and associated interaction domains-containing protein [Thalictrum thalictroides]|uniref:F-box and associated interaction domains-containing protein n=1 Tax=Thalictrum thalictroides TaxID=46969 RepID=A0A7J6VKC8_THATH|nr:F-box and associated interaction domains-containing protein [Thalictrum thalictroides]